MTDPEKLEYRLGDGCPACDAPGSRIEAEPATDGIYVCRSCGATLQTDGTSLTADFRTEEPEVIRRFPVLVKITDMDVRRKTIEALQELVPDYFWTAPAASSYDYHNPYCCGERGLWIHTLMVATAYERLVDSYVDQGRITEYEADNGRAAVLLHDVRKHGKSYEEGDEARRDHDLRAADLIRKQSDLGEQVAEAVATHMGPWYAGPDPVRPLQRLVHQADMAASTKNATWGIYGKPREITALYPGLPEAHL